MKLVQFLRPLFFVALGLHGLLLFIPTGETESAVIEDIALDERPESETNLLAAPPTLGSLPVPDPNVSSRASIRTAPAGATAKPAPTRVATRAATPARSAASARPSARTRPPVALRGAPNTNNTNEDKAENQNNNSSTETDSSESSQNNSSTPNNAQQTAANQSSLPDLLVQQAEQNESDGRPEGNVGGDTTNVSRLTALASSAIRDFPGAVESLEALVAAFDKSLAYNEAETMNERAKRSRDQWTANLQQQANTSSPESVAITEISDAFQISYPIQVSEDLLLEEDLKEQLSGREVSVCLEKDPSNAEVGVFFDAQGNVVDEPTILRSTGYLLLDEEVKAMVVNARSLPPGNLLASPQNRRSNAYILEVNVNYDKESCVSLSDLRG